MAPSILNESPTLKQPVSQDSGSPLRADAEVAPQTAVETSLPQTATGTPNAHIDASGAAVSAQALLGPTIGAAKILPADSGAGAPSPLTRPSEQRAVDAIVANIGASDGQPLTSAGPMPHTSRAVAGDVYRVDAPAADRATKHIVANISERSTDAMVGAANKTVAPSTAAAASSRDTSIGTSGTRSGSPAAANPSSSAAFQDVSESNAAAAGRATGPAPSKALSTSYAEGMEMLSAQSMLLRTDNMLHELQALVDAYAELHEDIDLQAPMPGQQLDAKTLMLLAQQAKHTDLGKLHADSAVYVLSTVPQTIIEDNPATKRYSIFNMAGECVGQFDHADAHTFGIDLGGGRLGAMGPGGLSASFHLLGPHGRTIISALGSDRAPGSGVSGRAKVDRKITRISSTGNAFNDAADCASSCFINQAPDDNGASDSSRGPGRCVLCKHQQQ